MTTTLIDELLLSYFGSADLGALDVSLVLDASLLTMRERGEDLGALASQLDELAQQAPSDDDARRLLPSAVADRPAPDGPGGHRAALLAIRDRTWDAANGTALAPAPAAGDGLTLPRASKFASEELANEACTLLVRRHYDLLKQLESGSLGWGAVHLYGDLGYETGDLGTVIVNPRPAGSSLAVDPGKTYETSCAVMVMRRDPESGSPYIDTAYPELALATRTREDFPALCHLFGAWFGQDHESPVLAMQQAFTSTSASSRAELAGDLDRLLDRPDDTELRLVLEACGSYILPDAVRPWLAATRRRVDTIAWS